MSRHDDNAAENDKIRLDKWLWAARFYKTRSIAQDMIDGGKVHYDGHRVKPGKEVHVGARITLTQGFDKREVIVREVSNKRGNAPTANKLYEETQASISAREEASARRKLLAECSPVPAHRPNKKERRKLIRFTEQASE